MLLLLLLAAAAVAVGAIPRERPEQHGCRTRETWPGGRPRLGREQLGTMQKCGWGKLLVCLLLLLLLLLAAAAAVAVAVVFVCPSHPCGFLVLRPLAGQPTIAFAVSSPLRPLRPSTFALGITRRFPGCRSRQPSFLDLPPRLRRAVAPAAPARWPQPLRAIPEPTLAHRRDAASTTGARGQRPARVVRTTVAGRCPRALGPATGHPATLGGTWANMVTDAAARRQRPYSVHTDFAEHM